MDSEESATSCSVCREVYSDPRCLACGHSFCLKCLKGVAGTKQKFPCPICRFDIDLGHSNIDQLPKNFVLCNVIEALDNKHASMCLDHNRSLDLFCQGCDVVICSKCLTMQHIGHSIQDIEIVFIERNKQYAAFLERTKHLVLMTEEKRDTVKQLRISMEKNIDSISKTVENNFKKWNDALQKKHNAILSYLHQERDQKRQVFFEAERILEGSITTVAGLDNEINNLRSKDTAYVVQQYGSVKARQEDTERKVLQDIETCFTPTDTLVLEVYAPWIEEAINNIKHIDMKHTQARSGRQKIAEIQEESFILKRECEKLRITLQELEKRECERHCNEMDALKGKLKHCEHLITSLKEEMLNTEKTIIGLKDENNELLNRLSKIASDRLTHENTDITDLSDEIRPSKLTEKMSELYDNQWTRAFDEMKTNGFQDENAIGILLKIVMETNQMCKAMAFSHYQKLKEACTCFEYSIADEENKEKGEIVTTDNISIEMKQDIKRIWRESSKKVLKKVIPIIGRKVAGKFDIPLLQMKQTPLYMKECAELCWMMNIQEKPMHLDISVPEKDGHKYFDTEKFRSYTKTGQHVAFVVWPALYLFEGGSLLKKGVAEGLKVKKGTSGQEHSSVPRP